MAHPELIDALRESAAQEAAAIWQGVRAEAEQCKADAAREVEGRRAQAVKQAAATAEELENTATAEADGEVRKIRMAASTTLAARAYRLAHDALPRFRGDDYEALFAALADEIPPRTWQLVRVNSADRGLAQTHFPDADIVSDPAIVGGMVVEGEEGRIQISNTLETRLTKAWPDILPDLIGGIFGEFSDYRSTA